MNISKIILIFCYLILTTFKNYLFLVVMNLSTKCNQDGRESNEIRGDKASKMSGVSGEEWDGIGGEKTNDVKLMKSVGTADGKSGGSGVAGCGVKVANVASCRVVVKKLQQGNKYWLVEDLIFFANHEEIMPITEEEWSSVLNRHNESNPDFDRVGERNEDSLHCQFCNLYQKCAPTGDPWCPENVQMAKRICIAIFKETQASTGKSYYIILNAMLNCNYHGFTHKICLGTTSNDDIGEETQQFTTIIDQDKKMSSSTTEQNALLFCFSSNESDNHETKKTSPFDIHVVASC